MERIYINADQQHVGCVFAYYNEDNNVFYYDIECENAMPSKELFDLFCKGMLIIVGTEYKFYRPITCIASAYVDYVKIGFLASVERGITFGYGEEYLDSNHSPESQS